ncbi:hypothetical protein GOODEAATRI_007965 [Goodea atripinnis]|uniref:Uncharacterized protein n=1 Tax=Goodea atripinnis TaxID=208336 RepID=A0ABV0P2C6_9TELE
MCRATANRIWKYFINTPYKCRTLIPFIILRSSAAEQPNSKLTFFSLLVVIFILRKCLPQCRKKTNALTFHKAQPGHRRDNVSLQQIEEVRLCNCITTVFSPL